MDFNNLLKRLAAISETQVREDDVEENAFNQAAADAAKQHKKEFEFPKGSGKMHPVKMDTGTAHKISEADSDDDDADEKHRLEKSDPTSDKDDADDKNPTNESRDLEECYGQAMMSGQQEEESGMNINASTDTRTGHKSLTVTAQGQAAEQLAQLLKLSGISSANPGHEAEMEEAAYANEPDPETQGVEVQMQQGTDMHRPKNSYPKVAGGDNPMAMREARELAEIEQRLNEELAAFKVVAEAAKWRDPKYKDRLYTQEPGDSDEYDDIDYGYGMRERPSNDPGQKRRMGGVGSKYDRTDPLEKGSGIGRTGIKNNINTAGKRKGLPSRDQVSNLKGSIKQAHGKHHKPNLPEQGVAEGKGKKPDFLDVDKDGDRKEPMKKALADKKSKKVDETVVAEKAVSRQQQKFMGMVHAMQKGEKVKGASPELKKAAKSMGRKDAKDFASTKHKGLPVKK